MDFGKLSLFELAKKRMSWLGQRQDVLAQNVANADTPGFRPKDLQPFKFQELVKSESMQVNMEVTTAGHLKGRERKITDFSAKEEQRPFETAPDGNAVVLEEQMAKVGENEMNHRLTTDIYKRNMGLIKEVLGKK